MYLELSFIWLVLVISCDLLLNFALQFFKVFQFFQKSNIFFQIHKKWKLGKFYKNTLKKVLKLGWNKKGRFIDLSLFSHLLTNEVFMKNLWVLDEKKVIAISAASDYKSYDNLQRLSKSVKWKSCANKSRNWERKRRETWNLKTINRWPRRL